MASAIAWVSRSGATAGIYPPLFTAVVRQWLFMSVPECRRMVKLVGRLLARWVEHRFLLRLGGSLKAAKRPLYVLVARLDANPSATQTLADLSGHAAPAEWVEHHVPFICEQDRKASCRESRRILLRV